MASNVKLSVGWLSSEFASLALTVLIPLALQAAGKAPNPIVAGAGIALSALYAVLRTWLKAKHLDAAVVASAVQGVEAGVEKATGKALPADVKTVVETVASTVVDVANAQTPSVP